MVKYAQKHDIYKAVSDSHLFLDLFLKNHRRKLCQSCSSRGSATSARDWEGNDVIRKTSFMFRIKSTRYIYAWHEHAENSLNSLAPSWRTGLPLLSQENTKRKSTLIGFLSSLWINVLREKRDWKCTHESLFVPLCPQLGPKRIT